LGTEAYNQEAIELIRKINASKALIHSLKAYLRIKQSLLYIKSLPQKMRTSFPTKKKIIATIAKTKDAIGLGRTLRLFRISKSTYHHWKSQIQFECNLSNIKLCFRKFPTQIANLEIHKIKKLCEDKIPLGWPLSSIWGYGRKKDILHLSLASFIHYVKILKLDAIRKKFKKKRKLGFVTQTPNQVWHADITIFTLLNGQKAYIYLLVDNFSKFILNYKISHSVSSTICKEMIEAAYDRFGVRSQRLTLPDLFPIVNLNLSKHTNFVHLMTDGGPENKGKLNEWIDASGANINKIIAQKDVSFSNSPIEALNKIIKYQFLHHQNISTLQELNDRIESWVPIYNKERPNRAGKYLLTPEEIYNDTKLDLSSLKEKTKIAKQDRIQENRNFNCRMASP
jgi:transposase InsO family protein